MSEQHFPYECTVDSIRGYIKQELANQHIPRKNTVQEWLEEFGQERINQRINDHISYWKPILTQNNNISSSPDGRKPCAPTILSTNLINF